MSMRWELSVLVEIEILLRITSRLREVRSPRKNFPRETELRIFSELKLNLGGKVCKTLEPLNRCSTLRALRGLDFNAMLPKGKIQSKISISLYCPLPKEAIF